MLGRKRGSFFTVDIAIHIVMAILIGVVIVTIVQLNRDIIIIHPRGTLTCEFTTCKAVEDYLGTVLLTREDENFGVDIILVFDRSSSMSGLKLKQAKDASKKLIELLSADERLAVFEFDDNAYLVQDFTEDQELVKSKIDSISVGRNTFYMPVLQASKKLLEDESSQTRKRIVIFLSDGQPWDEGKPDNIFAEVQQLAEEGVCVYSIGYGEGITKGSEAEYILTGMANISNLITGCGEYYYSLQDVTFLANIFNKIHREVTFGVGRLAVESLLSSDEISTETNLRVAAQVYSKARRRPIPGFINTSNETTCSPQADVWAYVTEEGVIVKDTQLLYLDGIGYLGSLANIPPGENYLLEVKADIHGGECDIIGSEAHELVVKEVDEDSCVIHDCDGVFNYVSQEVTPTPRRYTIRITDERFVPQDIVISDYAEITWVNIGQSYHTVTSGVDGVYDGLFNSGPIAPGDSYKRIFDTGGNFSYFCNITKMFGSTQQLVPVSPGLASFFMPKYNGSVDMTLILDRSGSMGVGNKLDMAENASVNFIDLMKGDDRVSLITFDENAYFRKAFTSDKKDLKKSINQITAGNTTRYLPALELAEANYVDGTASLENGWLIVFLSDGQPWDLNMEKVYSMAERLSNEGICLYTIGYGEEVYEGSRAEAILKKIASYSINKSGCGNYYYSPTNTTKLVKIFGKIYHEMRLGKNFLDLDANIDKIVADSNESVKVSTLVYSKVNRRELPGVAFDSGKASCAPSAKITASISTVENHTIKRYELPYSNYEYSAELSNIPAGEYVVRLDAVAEDALGRDCVDLTGTKSFPLTIKEPGSTTKTSVADDRDDKTAFLIKVLIVLFAVVLVELYLFGTRRRSKRLEKMQSFLER